ncbi:MAG: adenylate kinase [Chloroflexi bacterium]|jgi:adenylate kinase|nr:adenylate kinase [Chloroflexota bacterium]MBT7080863.1 adenylate kinase [Chloroflexota bacterium]
MDRAIYILLGAPGAGKGTLAAIISKEVDLAHIASGDLFREALSKGTDLGVEAKKYMDKGELVPDQITINMILDRIARPDCDKGLLLDGFPRTLEQAKALDEALAKNGENVTKALLIDVSTEEVVRRLGGRWICRDCQTPYHEVTMRPKVEGTCDKCGGQLYQRDDDKESTVRSRLEVYTKQTKPLIDYYGKIDKLAKVNGEGESEEVAKRLLAVV